MNSIFFYFFAFTFLSRFDPLLNSNFIFISFNTNAKKCCIFPMLLLFSHQSNSFVTPWTVAQQAPLFMGFPRQEYWRGLPFPCPGDLPDPELKPSSHVLLWQPDSLSLSFFGSLPKKPILYIFIFFPAKIQFLSVSLSLPPPRSVTSLWSEMV